MGPMQLAGDCTNGLEWAQYSSKRVQCQTTKLDNFYQLPLMSLEMSGIGVIVVRNDVVAGVLDVVQRLTQKM